MFQDFKKVFDSIITDTDDFGSDVTLVLPKRKFRAHKVILAAYSDFFATMFRSSMKESFSTEIQIESDAELFQLALEVYYPNFVDLWNLCRLCMSKISVLFRVRILKRFCKFLPSI